MLSQKRLSEAATLKGITNYQDGVSEEIIDNSIFQ
jgi:hypothetical protein